MTDIDGSAPAEDAYLLGTDDEELQRLGFQHQVWAAEARAHWDLARFGPGTRLLDLGCGPGYTTFELAQRVGATGQVLAVDRSPRFIAYLKEMARSRQLEQIDARCLEIADLELEAASIDGIYLRWVLCFLREPRAALERIVPALVPGGRLAVLDYFAYESFALSPRGPAADAVIAAAGAIWRRSGGSVDIGAKLPEFVVAAGLEIESLEMICSVGRPGEMKWKWPRGFFRGFAPRLAEEGLIDQETVERFESEMATREKDPAGYLTTPTMLQIVAVKR